MIIDGQHKAIELHGKIYHCALDITMAHIGGKWKCVVLWYLMEGTKRFSAIKKCIPDITEKMLSIQLKTLESDGLIHREVFGEKAPFRVEYSLTDFGKTLIPVLQSLGSWGRVLGESEGSLIDI